jgi:hypothetical protein
MEIDADSRSPIDFENLFVAHITERPAAPPTVEPRDVLFQIFETLASPTAPSLTEEASIDILLSGADLFMVDVGIGMG